MRTLNELLEACLSSALGEQARWTIRPFRFERNLDPRLFFDGTLALNARTRLLL